jgi:hypothetical protein
MNVDTLITFIDTNGGKTTINALTAGAKVTPNVAVKALFDAGKAGRIDATLSEAGQLVFTPSRKLIKAANRAKRNEQLPAAQDAILTFLGTQTEPVRIKPIVAATSLDRALVLEALRSLRDDGKVSSGNETSSNFHMRWSVVAADAS